MAMLSFLGGVGTVTGSKYLLESRHCRVLVDCGLFQGLKELRERNWQGFSFDPTRLDAVVLTHAHLDHSGSLPRLVKQGFRGPVYCSAGTAKLLQILLPDSARLQQEDARYRNRHCLTRHNPALPLYTERDAQNALRLLRPVQDAPAITEITPEIDVQFHNVGHILGARSVLATVRDDHKQGGGIRVLFSGDVGRYGRPILPDPTPPQACDTLVVESTYGDRLHPEEDPKFALARILTVAARRNSAILVPAFSVGRTQELLYLIRELEDERLIPVLPVIADSPMAAAATHAYEELMKEQDAENPDCRLDPRHPLNTHSMETTGSRSSSKRLNDLHDARIIISAAGMMTGGRVLHHARQVLPDPNATLILVGFQAAGTTGRRILDGETSVKIFKQPTPVRCHVERIEGFSAHADWKGVLRWLEGMPAAPQRVCVTHGEPEAAQAMREHVIERFGWNVEIPSSGDQITLP